MSVLCCHFGSHYSNRNINYGNHVLFEAFDRLRRALRTKVNVNRRLSCHFRSAFSSRTIPRAALTLCLGLGCYRLCRKTKAASQLIETLVFPGPNVIPLSYGE